MAEDGPIGWPPSRALLALPPGLFVLVGALVPMAILVVFSLFRVEDLTLVPAISFDSWSKIFVDPLYRHLVGISLTYGLITAALAGLFGYPLAIGIWRMSNTWKGVALIVLLTPLYTGDLMRLYAWRLVLGTEGLVNAFLLWIGIIHAPLKIMLFSPFAVHLVLFYDTLPFMVLGLLVSLERIDRDLIEASRDLGASPLDTFTRVILPLSIPGLAAGGFAVFALAAGDLLTPQLMGGTSGVTAMAMIDNLFGTAFDWPMASALAVALLVSLLACLVILGLAVSRLPPVQAVLRGGAR
jgi:spermidine/putrescine transport system permease protein